ncbi:unnamed protein product, partial [marine sediment metagenome]
MDNEIWKSIQEFLDYAVSNYGRVKRIKSGQGTYIGKILKPRINRRGYFYFGLMKNKKRYSREIHRFVLTAFNKPCPLKHEC